MAKKSKHPELYIFEGSPSEIKGKRPLRIVSLPTNAVLVHQTGTQDDMGWWGLQVPERIAAAIKKAIPTAQRGLGDLTIVVKPTRQGLQEIQRPEHDTTTVIRRGMVRTRQVLHGYMFGDAGKKV